MSAPLSNRGCWRDQTAASSPSRRSAARRSLAPSPRRRRRRAAPVSARIRSTSRFRRSPIDVRQSGQRSLRPGDLPRLAASVERVDDEVANEREGDWRRPLFPALDDEPWGRRDAWKRGPCQHRCARHAETPGCAGASREQRATARLRKREEAGRSRRARGVGGDGRLVLFEDSRVAGAQSSTADSPRRRPHRHRTT